MNTFGARLKLIQSEVTRTQKEFAQLLNISQGTLTDLIKNNTTPSAETINSLCRILIDTPNKFIWLLLGENIPTQQACNQSLTTDQIALLKIFDQLTTINKGKLIGRAETFLEMQEETDLNARSSHSASSSSGEEAAALDQLA